MPSLKQTRSQVSWQMTMLNIYFIKSLHRILSLEYYWCKRNLAWASTNQQLVATYWVSSKSKLNVAKKCTLEFLISCTTRSWSFKLISDFQQIVWNLQEQLSKASHAELFWDSPTLIWHCWTLTYPMKGQKLLSPSRRFLLTNSISLHLCLCIMDFDSVIKHKNPHEMMYCHKFFFLCICLCLVWESNRLDCLCLRFSRVTATGMTTCRLTASESSQTQDLEMNRLWKTKTFNKTCYASGNAPIWLVCMMNSFKSCSNHHWMFFPWNLNVANISSKGCVQSLKACAIRIDHSYNERTCSATVSDYVRPVNWMLLPGRGMDKCTWTRLSLASTN